MKGKLNYEPPYTVSNKSVNLIADIAAALERYKLVMEGPDGCVALARTVAASGKRLADQ